MLGMDCEEPAIADAEVATDAPGVFKITLVTGEELDKDGMFVPCKTGVSRVVAIDGCDGKLSSADECN